MIAIRQTFCSYVNCVLGIELSFYIKILTMKLGTISNRVLVIIFACGVFSCNEVNESNVKEASPKFQFENDFRILSDAMRSFSRLQQANAKALKDQFSVGNFEREMINELSFVFPGQFEKEYYNFKNNPTVSDLANSLSKSISARSGRAKRATLLEELDPIENELYEISSSQEFNLMTEDFNLRLLQMTEDYIADVESKSVLIDGEQYYSTEDFPDDEMFVSQVKNEVNQFENQIINNSNITLESKSLIFNYSSSIYHSIDDVSEYARLMYVDEGLQMMRTNGLWKKAKSLFKKVVTAVVTVVVTAVMVTAGVLTGLMAGPVGAVAGGLMGLYVGLEFSFYLNCKWFPSQMNCSLCGQSYPQFGC